MFYGETLHNACFYRETLHDAYLWKINTQSMFHRETLHDAFLWRNIHVLQTDIMHVKHYIMHVFWENHTFYVETLQNS